MRSWRKRRRNVEIDPDEIFLDVSNAANFDRARFEGRLEKPLSPRTFFWLTSTVGVFIAVLFIRAGYLQVVQGATFAAESAHNSLEVAILFAPRGIITDRNGVVLAENVERTTGGMGRYYPLPELGQIIGYVSHPKKDASGNYYDTRQKGIAGLEVQYDTYLTGTNGQVLTEKDALGNVRSEGVLVPAKKGETLKLSIDANLEKYLARAIAEVAQEKGFLAGAGVIMDVHTGEVHAIVSYPSYDPNVMSEGAPADVIAGYNTAPGHPFLDHAVQGVYTPGSIVKPFVSAGALTDGLITENTVIDDPGSLVLPDPYNPGKKYVYKGWRPLGLVDVRKAIAWSSDVFFYTVGGGFGNQKGMGIDRLGYWYRQFGMGTTTGVDLPGEASGLVPTPAWKEKTFKEPWYLGDTYFTAIGQYSMLVTPIQMVRATAALANGGKLLTPTLRMGQTPRHEIVPINASVLPAVRAGMRQTVTSTILAPALNLPYVTVAAKTGTAQTGVRNERDNSWVEGFFPYENPQYAFVVVLERGPTGSGGHSVTAMRRFFDALYQTNSPYIGGSGEATSTTAVAR